MVIKTCSRIFLVVLWVPEVILGGNSVKKRSCVVNFGKSGNFGGFLCQKSRKNPVFGPFFGEKMNYCVRNAPQNIKITPELKITLF